MMSVCGARCAGAGLHVLAQVVAYTYHRVGSTFSVILRTGLVFVIDYIKNPCITENTLLFASRRGGGGDGGGRGGESVRGVHGD